MAGEQKTEGTKNLVDRRIKAEISEEQRTQENLVHRRIFDGAKGRRVTRAKKGHLCVRGAAPLAVMTIDRVVLKWVFGDLLVCEGEVKAGETDWMGLCRSYVRIMGGDDTDFGSCTVVKWKCPRHLYPLLGGNCPAVRDETILNTNTDIDAVINHCIKFRVYLIHLHVGRSPMMRREAHATELASCFEQWIRNGEIPALPWHFRLVPRVTAAHNKNQRHCRACKSLGHNRKTCRRRKLSRRAKSRNT